MAPETLPFRRMSTGPVAFLCSPGVSGFRPYDWTYLRLGLVPYSFFWWREWQKYVCMYCAARFPIAAMAVMTYRRIGWGKHRNEAHLKCFILRFILSVRFWGCGNICLLVPQPPKIKNENFLVTGRELVLFLSL